MMRALIAICTLSVAASSHLYTISLTLKLRPMLCFVKGKLYIIYTFTRDIQRPVSCSGPSVSLSSSSLLLLLDFLRRKNSPNVAVTLCDRPRYLDEPASAGLPVGFSGEDSKAESPAEDSFPVRCDLDVLRLERFGRLLEFTPLRNESATTALKEEDRGDIKGAGAKRDTEALERVDGRSGLDPERRLWPCICGVDGYERWASEGRRGDDMVFSRGRGLEGGVRRLLEDCQGSFNEGDS